MERLPGGASFLKPLGQKTTVVEGIPVGEDSWFLDKALHLDLPLENSSPFTASSGAAENYLSSGEPGDILKRIHRAYRALCSANDLVVVEGTGHPGVGSVFDLSNAEVALALDIPVILVIDGGIGSTIDRFSLCRALFQVAGVRIAGVVINRVLPSRMEKVSRLLTEWFQGEGIPVLGFIPWLKSISRPSLGMLSRALDAEYVGSNECSFSPSISGFITAFGNRNEVLREVALDPSSAIVLSAGRMDIIDALVARRVACGQDAGPGALILCGEGEIDPGLVNACDRLDIPLYRTVSSAGQAASTLSGRTFKVEPDESRKIEETVELVKSSVDMDAVLEILEHPPHREQDGDQGLLERILEKPASLIRRLWRSVRRRS
jgi:hypothetical protein